MSLKWFIPILVLIPVITGGCGGYYILSVPDQVAPADGQAVPVARLQRNDFFFVSLPNPNEPLQFKLYKTRDLAEDTVLDLALERKQLHPGRAAYTDEGGYAGAVLPMADQPVVNRPGIYYMRVTLQDSQMGEQIYGVAPLFVWETERPVVAVDLQSLPEFSSDAGRGAGAFLKKIAETNNILYLTKQQGTGRDFQHFDLTARGFPQGPVMLWEKRNWRIVFSDKYGVPIVKFGRHMVSPLPQLMKQFPNFKCGIAANRISADHFLNAGLMCVGIGGEFQTAGNLVAKPNWDALAQDGLPKAK